MFSFFLVGGEGRGEDIVRWVGLEEGRDGDSCGERGGVGSGGMGRRNRFGRGLEGWWRGRDVVGTGRGSWVGGEGGDLARGFGTNDEIAVWIVRCA